VYKYGGAAQLKSAIEEKLSSNNNWAKGYNSKFVSSTASNFDDHSASLVGNTDMGGAASL
jgi:hypothetical protein